MAQIHNLKKRMPLILSQEAESQWLNPTLSKEEISKLLQPYNMDEMQSFPITNQVNQVRNERNVPETLEPVTYPELTHFA